jgi:ADP-glucose pyrophosphorylase
MENIAVTMAPAICFEAKVTLASSEINIMEISKSGMLKMRQWTQATAFGDKTADQKYVLTKKVYVSEISLELARK